MTSKKESAKKKIWISVALVTLLLIAGLATGLSFVFLSKQRTGDDHESGDDRPPIEQTYTVTWMSGDTILETDENVKTGAMPSYDGNTPWRSSNDEAYFNFIGWDKPLETVSDNVVYSAVFEKKPMNLVYEYDKEAKSYSVAGFKVGYEASTEIVISNEHDGNEGLAPVVKINEAAIGSKDFDHFNDTLNRLVIPSSLKSVGAYAFRGCKALAEVLWPHQDTKLTNIDDYAFSYSGISGALVLPASVGEIGFMAFAKNPVTKIILPPNLTTLSTAVFSYCDELVEVKSSPVSALQVIDTRAFAECHKLESIDIPATVTEIGDVAFIEDTSLKSVNVIGNSNLARMGIHAFWKCFSLTSIDLPNGFSVMGEGAFEDCRSLKEISLPATVKKIPKDAFFYCQSLHTVYISDDVESIDTHALAFTALTTLYIPASVKFVGLNILDACAKLESVLCGAPSLPDSWVKQWLGSPSSRIKDVLWGQARPAELSNTYQAD